jgi:hypothetical protein
MAIVGLDNGVKKTPRQTLREQAHWYVGWIRGMTRNCISQIQSAGKNQARRRLCKFHAQIDSLRAVQFVMQ